MAESWDIQFTSTPLLLPRSAHPPSPAHKLLHSHSTSSWPGEVKKPPTVTQQWKVLAWDLGKKRGGEQRRGRGSRRHCCHCHHHHPQKPGKIIRLPAYPRQSERGELLPGETGVGDRVRKG